jgi:molybdenum cofactor biosynthesis enzyme MoaA
MVIGMSLLAKGVLVIHGGVDLGIVGVSVSARAAVAYGARYIGAVTENFCASCNRLRVSATGQLHACLARDEHGDLRAALRSGDPERLGEVVRGVLTAKQDGHDFRLDGSGGPHKTMVSIGG